MSLFKSSNPAFRENIYNNREAYPITEKAMSTVGTMNKLTILSAIMLIAAAAVYYQFSVNRLDYVSILMTFGLGIGFIVALIISFLPKTAMYLSPIYAFAEGAYLSGISCYMESAYPGIVMQAISITLLDILVMAILYKIGLIRATRKFRTIVIVAGGSIALFYFASFILMFFGVNVPYFTSTSTAAIVLNIGIAFVASLFLILDFDNIERGEQMNLPSYFEWYFSFGLLLTIVWLYIEILSILGRYNRR
ncbi:MAG: Bax inhibitor-1/YccA family protein [Candidatus Gastranaerophilales bacterium]|nr:Bax inhibitor-1/YccA family protein [Candidatus Gastranaerophilales bacterium]